MEKWQLQEAKNRFSELVKKALQNGPQVVTRHGTEAVVIISVEEYQRLLKPKTDLVSFFRQSPLYNSNIDFSRQKDSPREVVL
jgi:prevent-host-death family protein